MLNNNQKIIYKYERLTQATSTLVDAFALYHHDLNQEFDFNDSKYERIFLAARDSVTTRFNYTFDCLWKYIRLYLEHHYDTIVQGGPRDIFRMCLTLRLLSADDVEKCLEMVDSRNEASHMYKEEVANLVVTKMGDYIAMIEKILKTMRP